MFLLIPFSNIKKSILTNLRKPGAIFCWSLFQILKKAYLQILKNLAQFFCSSLFQILRISKTPLFILKTIYIKTIIQIYKHKVKYIITACIPIIIIKKIYFFSLLCIRMNEWKEHKFWQQKYQEKWLLQ